MGQWRAVVDVPAALTGPTMARRVVAAVMDGWDLSELSDDAQLVVTELVTNAYQHAPGTDSFELEIVRRSDGVRIMLADGSSIRPVIRALDAAENDGPSGRGMALVEHLSADWGAEDHHGGKRVWLDLLLPDGRG